MQLKANIYQLILWLVFTLMMLVGFTSIYSPFISIKNVFTITIFFFALLLVYRIDKKLVPILLILLLYLSYSLIILFTNPINVFDYLTVFLCFYYAAILLFFTKKKLISIKFYNTFFTSLLVVFLLKYLFMYFNFPYYRPRLFIENNFELLFLSILLVGSIKYSNKINFVNLLMFSFIAISSKSRSGIAIFFFIIFICYFKKEYLKIKYLWIYLLIALCLVIGIDQVIQRIPEGGIESIDRFRFFFFFLEEIKDWSFLNYLFGESIITPLSPSTCSKLSYYDQLYSFKGDGTCYSVIFHSFILRIIFDHGFLGFLFLFYIIKKVLSMSRFSIRHTIALIGVLLLNSISISSLNSIFSIFAIMIILMVKSKEKK